MRDGFSLLEVLVSVFILAVIGVMGASLLTTALASRDTTQDRLAALEQLDLTRTLLRDDIAQIAIRPVRGPDGARLPYVFAGGDHGSQFALSRADRGDRVLLAFTRRGWANPGRQRPRSTLQYVEYVLADDRLVRRAWAYPDRAPDTPDLSRILIDGLDAVEIEFLFGSSWRDSALAPAEAGSAALLPRGVRLRYEHDGLGPLEHVVLTPEAG